MACYSYEKDCGDSGLDRRLANRRHLLSTADYVQSNGSNHPQNHLICRGQMSRLMRANPAKKIASINELKHGRVSDTHHQRHFNLIRISNQCSMLRVILLSLAIASLSVGLSLANNYQQELPPEAIQVANQAGNRNNNVNPNANNRQQITQQNVPVESTTASNEANDTRRSSAGTTETNSPSSSTTTVISASSSTVYSSLKTSSSTQANSGDLSASPSSTSTSAVNSNNQQQQARKVSSSGGNRWTHFGARLRPLTPTGTLDHHETSANTPRTSASRAPASGANTSFRSPDLQLQQPKLTHMSDGSFSSQAGRTSKQLATVQANNLVGPPMGSNNLDTNGSDDTDDDDDFDGEALLYKMMQQQNFLMNPSWQGQQQQSVANSNNPSQDTGQQQQQSANGNDQSIGQQQQQRRRQQQEQRQRADNLSESKKVIKLLKSYSHIHQVDDSDDQIRGTYTRLSAYRPKGKNHHSNGRQNNNRQASSARQQHIFVSSKPLATSQLATEPRVYATQRQAGRQGAAGGDNSDDGGDYPLSQPTGNNLAPNDDSGSSDSGDGGQSGPDENEFECPNNGIFADTASGCQSYHVCQSGAQVQEKFQCPLGTLFNDIILTCDFAHNVQCGGTKPGKRQPAESSTASISQAQQGAQQEQQQPQAEPQFQQQQRGPLRPQAQQRVASAQRPAQQQGPRQLTIGANNNGPSSPYNRHVSQSPSQAQALATYPAVRPLSNSIGQSAANSDNNNNNEDNDSEDGDDKEGFPEPLVAATLPPRVAPAPAPRQPTLNVNTRNTLPYLAPPQPQQFTTTTTTARTIMPTSIQQQIPHQANRQSAHLSQYHQHASSPQLRQSTKPLVATTRPRQQDMDAFYTTSSVTPPSRQFSSSQYGNSATLATPVFAEPDQRTTEPSVSPSRASPSVGNSDQAQSFNLVINHLMPTHGSGSTSKPAEVPSGAALEIPRLPTGSVANNAPVYKSNVLSVEQSRRTNDANKPREQQQATRQSNGVNRFNNNGYGNNNLNVQLPPLQPPPAPQQQLEHRPQREQAPIAVQQPPNRRLQPVQQQRQQQQQQQRQNLIPTNGATYPKQQRYDSRREPTATRNQAQAHSQQQQSQQHQNQYQQQRPRQLQQVAAPRRVQANYGSETGASQPPPTVAGPEHDGRANSAPVAPNGVVDLTNNAQIGVGSDALNDGLLLIVRHSSGAPPLQVGSGSSNDYSSSYEANSGQDRNKLQRSSSNKQQSFVGSRKQHGASGAGQAFAVDPKLVRPDSPIDAQLFPNVQQLIASSAGSATQASTLQVSHQAPPLAPAGSHNQHQAAAPKLTSIRIRGPLPAMEPPRPLAAGHKSSARQHGHNEQPIVSGSNSDQLASAASTSSASSATTTSAAHQLGTPTNQRSSANTTTTTTTTSISMRSGGSRQQQVIAARLKRAKRLKAAESSPDKNKPQQQASSSSITSSGSSSTTTSTTTPATIPSSSTAAAATSTTTTTAAAAATTPTKAVTSAKSNATQRVPATVTTTTTAATAVRQPKQKTAAALASSG